MLLEVVCSYNRELGVDAMGQVEGLGLAELGDDEAVADIEFGQGQQ